MQLTIFDKLKRKLYIYYKAISRDMIGFTGIIILLFIILLSLIAPYIFPVPERSDPGKILEPPSREHWLGTDNVGKDVWAQIANGGRDLIFLALITASVSIFIGIFLGAASALIGGKFDEVLLFLADVWLTIPRLPLLVVLSGFFDLNSIVLALVLAILSWAGLYRKIRAEVLSLKESEYIEAAFMLDLGRIHIIFREILPNMIGFISMNFTLMMRHAIYAQVGLVFLGLLPLENNWGVMINVAWTQGAIYNKDAIWFILSPTIAISLLILSLVWVNRVLNELFDPTLRGEE